MTIDNNKSADLIVGPPWELRGNGHILFSWGDKSRNLQDAFIPNGLKPWYRGLINLTMFVNYKSSPVGPYRELLYIPGVFLGGGQAPFFSISKIYVDSISSTVSGRANWGIPKEMASFRLERAHGNEVVSVIKDDKEFVSYDLKAFGPKLPIAVNLFPPSLRRFGQLLDGKFFKYVFDGKGYMQLAKVNNLQSDRGLFPDLRARSPFLSLSITNFSLRFPVPESVASWSKFSSLQPRSVEQS